MLSNVVLRSLARRRFGTLRTLGELFGGDPRVVLLNEIRKAFKLSSQTEASVIYQEGLRLGRVLGEFYRGDPNRVIGPGQLERNRDFFYEWALNERFGYQVAVGVQDPLNPGQIDYATIFVESDTALSRAQIADAAQAQAQQQSLVSPTVAEMLARISTGNFIIEVVAAFKQY